MDAHWLLTKLKPEAPQTQRNRNSHPSDLSQQSEIHTQYTMRLYGTIATKGGLASRSYKSMKMNGRPPSIIGVQN